MYHFFGLDVEIMLLYPRITTSKWFLENINTLKEVRFLDFQGKMVER